MQKIVPHLWFAKEAVAAVTLYTSLFPDSKITHQSVIKDTPSGDCDMLSFTVQGYSMMAISAGPYFTLNPSISFMVNFDPSREADAKGRLDATWAALSDGGKVMMQLGEYPFSKWYGWVQDKYGVSWQLILTNPEGEERPPIIPSLLFVNGVCGKTEEATDYYLSVFKDAKRGMMTRYPAGMEPDKEGSIMFTDFTLCNQWFVAMDSAHKHEFNFNEALSFVVKCDTQEEVDYYWEKLSHVPEAEQCGWAKDRYGVSWQIVPRAMDDMMSTGTADQKQRVTAAFLQMKKFDIATLEKAFAGE
jgi:predicted 3-demethylubiquinone-9 3-methyltransferase (glyoxalase superfamily)